MRKLIIASMVFLFCLVSPVAMAYEKEVVGVSCMKISDGYYAKTIEFEWREGNDLHFQMKTYMGSLEHVKNSGAVKGCKLEDY